MGAGTSRSRSRIETSTPSGLPSILKEPASPPSMRHWRTPSPAFCRWGLRRPRATRYTAGPPLRPTDPDRIETLRSAAHPDLENAARDDGLGFVLLVSGGVRRGQQPRTNDELARVLRQVRGVINPLVAAGKRRRLRGVGAACRQCGGQNRDGCRDGGRDWRGCRRQSGAFLQCRRPGCGSIVPFYVRLLGGGGSRLLAQAFDLRESGGAGPVLEEPGGQRLGGAGERQALVLVAAAVREQASARSASRNRFRDRCRRGR